MFVRFNRFHSLMYIATKKMLYSTNSSSIPTIHILFQTAQYSIKHIFQLIVLVVISFLLFVVKTCNFYRKLGWKKWRSGEIKLFKLLFSESTWTISHFIHFNSGQFIKSIWKVFNDNGYEALWTLKFIIWRNNYHKLFMCQFYSLIWAGWCYLCYCNFRLDLMLTHFWRKLWYWFEFRCS